MWREGSSTGKQIQPLPSEGTEVKVAAENGVLCKFSRERQGFPMKSLLDLRPKTSTKKRLLLLILPFFFLSFLPWRKRGLVSDLRLKVQCCNFGALCQLWEIRLWIRKKKVNSEALLETPLLQNPDIIFEKPTNICQAKEIPQCIWKLKRQQAVLWAW